MSISRNTSFNSPPSLSSSSSSSWRWFSNTREPIETPLYLVLVMRFFGSALQQCAVIGATATLPIACKFSTVPQALCYGAGMTSVLSTVERITRGQNNPALTVGSYVSQAISAAQASFETAMQIFGALVGMYTIKVVMGTNSLEIILNTATPPTIKSLLTEISASFTMALVSKVTHDSRNIIMRSGVSKDLGITISAAVISALKYTGATLNPADVISKAVILGLNYDMWISIFGSTLGSILASIVYDFSSFIVHRN